MPLIAQDALDAWESLRRNKNASWPSKKRGGERLFPLAQPFFSTDFTISSNDNVFTIGSCFARNIEEALADIGLNVITGNYSVPESEWEGRANGILNKYHPYAMLNELVWALDEKCTYPINDGIVESAPGKWIDLHLPGVAKPVSRERAIIRRQEISALYEQVKQCRLILLTPGLVEAWWDIKTNCYTNQTIPRKLIQQHPGRFQWHVLSYQETYEALTGIVTLLNKHCQPDLRIFITVSPVPLAATFSDNDILVANTYSKSVLRAAVEQVVSENKNVEYFPSFESITLSDREQVFGDDCIHVKDTAVRNNIWRFATALGHEQSDLAKEPSRTVPSPRIKIKPKIIRGMVSMEVRNNVISGWAFNYESDVPVLIKILINGSEVGSCSCTEMRRTLLERSVHKTGLCGFSFPAGSLIQDGAEIQVIDAKTGIHLTNSPFTFSP